ncbi:PPOX class F420-dependent oxidoreductase [Tengunoibacter tsumagoiensis]|uniref:PPOX class F420-dependent enzyme n=1 Tax=Tengunoibacter tsumagoiensis TaxID=2014871 RepID=A0A402A3V9_9CHLR|nr:PPOX class F420-dependent oxidoreductase [Tengunoibacter tsumagoiensis]GCE13681.1 PPOX class F420-dependent enzyme [Tengunoibacter tsumagoiensis]
MSILTPECRDFLLAQARTGKIATVRADGRPHVVPIWFDLEDDTLIFTTWHASVKALNMQRDARVCICVDDERPPFTFAILEGTATFSEDLAQLTKWAARIGGRYMGEDQAEAYGKRNGVAGELLVKIKLTKALFQKDIAS